MNKILDWVKRNWFSVILMLLVIYMFGRSNNISPMMSRNEAYLDMETTGGIASPMMSKSVGTSIFNGYRQAAPTDTAQRMVVQDTSLSMQVKDVAIAMTGIEKTAVEMGGYMVNRSMVKPEGAASGNIVIRVSAGKREETIKTIKELGIKTVSENVIGQDVTDQYVDIQGRIDNLNKTKSKIQVLMDQATRVQDLMDIQMQLNEIQSQIDSYLGQQKYLEQTAKLTKIAVNLSTDELALPYAPDSAWRPAVVVKTAVRSMIGALRVVANSLIWLVIYLPVIAILLAVYWAVKFVWKKYQPKKL